MKKEAIILFFIFSIFLSGCSMIPTQNCESGFFTEEGECCTYVCDLACPTGFVEGTCQCECIPDNQNLNNNQDTNIGDIFDDNSDIEPPPLPI